MIIMIKKNMEESDKKKKSEREREREKIVEKRQSASVKHTWRCQTESWLRCSSSHTSPVDLRDRQTTSHPHNPHKAVIKRYENHTDENLYFTFFLSGR